jgi:hypothetical protein
VPIRVIETGDGGAIIVVETVAADFPPKKRKIDPNTIQWPEGVPKPWEKNKPADDPPAKSE